MFIVEAASRKELIERSSRLYDFLTQAKEVTLKDLAFTLNTQLKGQGSRLALIATSRDDLAQKLVLALGRLADPKCRQVKDNAGIYFFERRLEGKLAFVFRVKARNIRTCCLTSVFTSRRYGSVLTW